MASNKTPKRGTRHINRAASKCKEPDEGNSKIIKTGTIKNAPIDDTVETAMGSKGQVERDNKINDQHNHDNVLRNVKNLRSNTAAQYTTERLNIKRPDPC